MSDLLPCRCGNCDISITSLFYDSYFIAKCARGGRASCGTYALGFSYDDVVAAWNEVNKNEEIKMNKQSTNNMYICTSCGRTPNDCCVVFDDIIPKTCLRQDPNSSRTTWIKVENPTIDIYKVLEENIPLETYTFSEAVEMMKNGAVMKIKNSGVHYEFDTTNGCFISRSVGGVWNGACSFVSSSVLSEDWMEVKE